MSKKKKKEQQTVKNDNLMDILKSNFNRSNFDGIKFTTSSKTGATKLEKKNSTTVFCWGTFGNSNLDGSICPIHPSMRPPVLFIII